MHRLAIALLVTLLFTSAGRANLTFSCPADNDLYALIAARDASTQRFDTPAAAVEHAPDGSALLILADGYPKTPTPLDPSFFDTAKRKNLRLYVEFPSFVPNLDLGPVRGTTWERGVVASDFFGPSLAKMSIVAPHDCHFLPTPSNDAAPLVVARVAGYDEAVYGLPKEHYPLLLEMNDGRWLIATTKLSGFVSGRYAPTASWAVIWRTILSKLTGADVPPLTWAPHARPAYGADAPLPADVERQAFNAYADWHHRAGLLIHPSRDEAVRKMLAAATEVTAPLDTPAGDGSLGMLEGYASQIRTDGTQPLRTPVRYDCNAEAAMVLALDARMNASERSHAVAKNLLDFCYVKSNFHGGVRADPKHPAFGLIAWGTYSPAWEVATYGDDNARGLLATMLASASLGSRDYDRAMTRALLANLRTTGTLGFRGDRVDVPALEANGWRHFRDAPTVNHAPHFETYLWACYLRAHALTGDAEFLDRTLVAIRMTMDAYAKGQWRWNGDMERAKMLLTLAWLHRTRPSDEHRAWVMKMADDLLESQVPSGAIRERLREAGGGHYVIPQSNEAYGTGETPLIQRPGDPACDQLYTSGFALLALHEAHAATGDERLRDAADRLTRFLCRIQIRSEKYPHLSGAWFRAFDFERWDYWASSADLGWGAWAVETGWGNAWTAAVLALRAQGSTLWDATNAVDLKGHLEAARAELAQTPPGPWKR